MQSLKASFPNVSNDLSTAQLIAHAEAANEEFGCTVDIEAFNYSTAVTSSGFAIPVTYAGNEKGLLRVVKSGTWELKELPVLKALKGRGAVSLIASNQNTINGEVIENVHLLERTRNSNKLANMVLIEGKDDEATRIATGVVKKIHTSPNAKTLKDVVRDYSKWAGDIQKVLDSGRVPFTLVRTLRKLQAYKKTISPRLRINRRFCMEDRAITILCRRKIGPMEIM